MYGGLASIAAEAIGIDCLVVKKTADSSTISCPPTKELETPCTDQVCFDWLVVFMNVMQESPTLIDY